MLPSFKRCLSGVSVIAALCLWVSPGHGAPSPFGPFGNPVIGVSLTGNTADLGIEHDAVVNYTSQLLEKAGVANSTEANGGSCTFEVMIVATQLHALDNPDVPMNGEVACITCRAGRYIDDGCFVYWEQQVICGAIGVSGSLVRAQLQTNLESLVQQFAIAYHQHHAQ